MIETDLFPLLSGDPGVAAVVGDRIYPQELPTDPVMPAITWQIVAGKSTPGLTTVGSQRWMLQTDCYGESYLDAARARAALIKLLALAALQTADGRVIKTVFIEPRDLPYSGGDELYHAGADFYLLFQFPSAS